MEQEKQLAYIVTGIGRSGTSMMMHCLGLGGMELLYDPEYLPYPIEYNPDGYYETPGNPKIEVGKVSKVGVKNVWVMGIKPVTKVVVMLRNPEDINESRKRIGMHTPSDIKPGNYYKTMLDYIRRWSCNRALDVTVLVYGEVLQAPEYVFRVLSEKGWPVDPEKAAKGVRG